MKYKLKIILDNTEVFESDDNTVKTPFISGVSLKMSTALTPMEIGATASDALFFTLYNPFKNSFDGSQVDFYISPQFDTSTTELAEIEAATGDATTLEVIDINDTVALYDDDEEGEPLTPEEIADTEAAEVETIETTFAFYNGEETEIVDVETSEEPESEWRKVGTYYVFKQTNSTNDNTIRFECLDGFSKLNDIYTPTAATASIQDIYNDLKAQALEKYGVEVEAFEYDDVDNIAVTWDLGVSFRASMGYLAGLAGGYAAFDSNNVLSISFYSYNDTVLLNNRVISYDETSAGLFEFDGVACDRSVNPYRDDIIETGAGQGVAFVNPFVTDEILENIYTLYKGAKYSGANVKLIWDENILAGQFIRIMEPVEYANFVKLNNALAEPHDDETTLQLMDGLASLGKTILVSNQTIEFRGDAISTITSVCNTEYETANKVVSPKDAVFRNLYAEMIEADYLRAKGAFIADLTAENLKVGAINGNVIKNSAVLAKALSNEMVETVTGSKVYYQADEPTGGTYNDGDIWYKTLTDEVERPYTDTVYVYEAGAWVVQPFETDGGILRANLITAQEIAANSITANEIDTATIKVIGDENEYYLNLEANKMGFYKGDDELFKIVAQAPEVAVLTSDYISDAEDLTGGSWLMISNKPKFVKSITDANGQAYDGLITDRSRKYNCIAVPNVLPSGFAYPVTVKYYADYTVYDAITSYGDAKIIGDGYYSGNINAKEHYCRSQHISLGRYVASGILTSTGGALEFSIPTGRVFDPEAYIKNISFNILMRATNAAGTGYYIIKGSSGGTNSAVLDWNIDKEYTTSDPVMDFYDGANNHRTPRVKPDITLEGGTNIRVRWDTDTSHYFSGNTTVTNNANNNACVVWLGNIEIDIEQPEIIEVVTDEEGISTPAISGGLL